MRRAKPPILPQKCQRVDVYKRQLPPKLTTLKLYMPLTADLYERNEYGDFDDSSTLLERCV